MKQTTMVKGDKKLLFAWAFYDWSNSVFNLVITTAIFPIFYGVLFRTAGIESVEVFDLEIARGPLISYVTSLAFVFVALLNPLLSGIADYLGNKKFFLKAFAYLGALSCIAMYWFSLDFIYYSLACYFFGLVGFWISYAFSNSYLPDIAYEDQQDWISAKGFSLGYIGSVLLLLFDLAMVMNPQWFGISDSVEDPAAIKAMRYSFVTVGIWWILFSQYTFYHLPKGYKKEGERTHLLLNGIRELKLVYKKLSHSPRLKSFLKAFFVYGMAVQTIMLVAAFYGEEKIDWGSDQMRTTGLIISMLVIQLIAIIGATLTAKASKQYGNIPVLILINVIWICICVYAYFMETPMDFYIAAGCVGMVMGGIQSLSRSTYSKFLPETQDTASYFSFFDVTEKIGIVIGTFVYGAVAQFTGDIRHAIVILGLFFVGGALLLTKVNKKAVTLD